MGRVPDDARLVGLGYRYLVMDDFLAFYVVQTPDVVIHRILHGTRDYGKLL